jgi:PAS domain S-box-containing protein
MQRYTEGLRLLHALSLSVLATDVGGVVTFANDAATEMFNRSAEELVGSGLADLIGGDSDATRALALAAVLGGTRWRGDLAVRRHGADSIVAAVTVTPVREPLGTVVGAIVALEDMTEIRSVEAEAAASEQRLRLAHAAAELGTWHWSALDDSNVWDEQMHRIYGLAPGGFDGSWDAWVGSIHPDDRDDAVATVQKAMAELSTYVLRHRILRPDGTLRWIEAHGKVLVGPAGTPAGTIGCVQDVTVRIEMQHRQEDAAARALLLQQVTADFSRAWTPDQVATVLATSLERVRAIVGVSIELEVPQDLTAVAGSGAFVTGARHPLSDEDAQLLDTLASQCAMAAERAELFRRTTEISEDLQFSLAASPLPKLDRFEISAYYAPGGDDLEHVGGDWYDAIGTATGGLFLVVGDVMGRGVRAATTMIHVRAGIRGLLTVQPSPVALLTAADEMMARDAPYQFVTAAAALLDPDAGTLELSNAGHVPLVLVHPDGTTDIIGLGSGAPLGVLPSLGRMSDQVALEPGCVAVMVTDGVVESRDRDIDHGIERLRRRAAELADGPLDRLVEGIAALADKRLRDDVTVVAARLR